MRKGLWSPDEDEKLKSCIALHRNGSWSEIARKAGLQRCGKSCRRRWMNHLRPDLKRQKFSHDELKLVAKLHQTLGNKWSEIATYLVGRTDNDVKNLWNTQLKKQSRIANDEIPLRTKGNDIKGFPFSVESKFDPTTFKKSQVLTFTSSSMHNSLVTSSWESSSINASSFKSDLEPQDIMERKHGIVDRLDNPFHTCTSYAKDFAQMLPIYQHAKLEEGLGCSSDECTQVDNADDYAIPMGCKTKNHFNDGMHCSYYKGDHTQTPSLNQHVKLIEEVVDDCPLVHNKDACVVPPGFPTLESHHDGDISCSYYLPTNLSSFPLENIGMDQQLESHFTPSYKASLERTRSSNESTTSIVMVVDDTCSVSKPSLFDLHHKLHFQQGEHNNIYGQDQKDESGGNCISKRESWSSSSCDQWALETLIGTCEEDTWY